MLSAHVLPFGGAFAAAFLAALLSTGAQAQAVSQTTVRPTISQSVVPGPARRLRAEVFANSDTMVAAPASDYDLQIFRVDAIRMLELELDRGLPPNEAEATAVLRRRIKSMGAQFAERTRQGALALSTANSYGLRSVPAVVFDGQAIVYGTADVEAAARIYAAGRAQRITHKRPNPALWNSQGGPR